MRIRIDRVGFLAGSPETNCWLRPMNGSFDDETVDQLPALKMPDAAASRATTVIDARSTTRKPPPIAHLIFVGRGSRTRRAPISSSRVVIGRNLLSDVVLDEPSVSWTHAAIEPSTEGWFRVTDLGSTNGTFINGVKVVEAYMRNGDALTVGNIALRLEALGVAAVKV